MMEIYDTIFFYTLVATGLVLIAAIIWQMHTNNDNSPTKSPKETKQISRK